MDVLALSVGGHPELIGDRNVMTRYGGLLQRVVGKATLEIPASAKSTA